MDQVNINVITLDNNKKYEVIDRVIIDNKIYLLLINEEDEKDKCIRKYIKEDGKEMITTLELDELEKVLEIFTKKYKGDR